MAPALLNQVDVYKCERSSMKKISYFNAEVGNAPHISVSMIPKSFELLIEPIPLVLIIFPSTHSTHLLKLLSVEEQYNPFHVFSFFL